MENCLYSVKRLTIINLSVHILLIEIRRQIKPKDSIDLVYKAGNNKLHDKFFQNGTSLMRFLLRIFCHLFFNPFTCIMNKIK